SSRRRHTRFSRDWSSDVCSSDLIDGEVQGWFTDDTPKRFEAYGWQVIRNVDGHDADEIKQAIETARKNTEQPTLICCKTTIGFGSPNKAGKEESHDAPLGNDVLALT